MDWQKKIDDRRDIIIPGDYAATLKFCVDLFIFIANKAILEHGYFAVALSGGSTPKAIFQTLAQEENRSKIDWKHVLVFWSDERCVPHTHVDSNYRMAMDAGFNTLPIPIENIFPMQGEGDLEHNALEYEKLIVEKIPLKKFDLIMLGMGDDGHTASLFPHTQALHDVGHLVVPNFLAEKNVWRMSLTFDCINAANHIIFYVLGSSKASTLRKVLSDPYNPNALPAQRIGTQEHKALWIVDNDAASQICKSS